MFPFKIFLSGGFWVERTQCARQGDSLLLTLGLSEAAQADLGELTFVELAPPGRFVSRGQSLGIVESVKSVQELMAPLDGTVEQVNEAVLLRPELINESPLELGWLLKIRVEDDASWEQLSA